MVMVMILMQMMVAMVFLRLAQVVEVMHYKDTDGADIDADDGGSSNLGLAQVIGIRSW